jgi:flagellar L-ring protein precursor FlgH
VGLACAFAGLGVRAQTDTGSMIDPDAYRGLVADRRAHQVGDTLTVVVTETARAMAGANTGADTGVQLAANVQGVRTNRRYGLGLSGDDAGQGQTTRVGTLQAQLAVRVVAVEGDGMLRIHGEQTVVVNGEKQQFALTGLVRSADISAAGQAFLDTAQAKGTLFTGKGDVSEAQRHSLLYRITRWLGLI